MPGDDGPPPSEVLAGLVASLHGELVDALTALEQARAELAQARERIAELEARLRQDPRNSSRPPSSEGLGKPAPRPRSLRKRCGRKRGGHDGHMGMTLARVARPDREVRHEPGCCGRCAAGLAGRPVTGVERRQVFDLQPVRAEMTEHQLIERHCGCARTGKYTLLMVHPKRGTEAMQAMGVLGSAARLRDRQDDYLRFTTDFQAPPDNNGSERDIRMAKLRQKVSGCLRTLTGARQFCAIRSHLSTGAKHGISFFDALVMLTKGESWLPAAS